MLSMVDLALIPDVVPVVARWHWEEWGHGDPGGSLQTWTAGLRERTDARRATTWIAMLGAEPVGSVSLSESDMTTHRELSPWLSALFVVSEHRGEGIGVELVRHCERSARARGDATLHLYTTTAAQLYRRLGWWDLGSERYGDEEVRIMARDLR